MRYPITSFLAFVFCLISQAQGYIGKSRNGVNKSFAKYTQGNKYQHTITETDSSLTLILRDPKVQPLDIYVHFDARDKVDLEVMMWCCDSCYNVYIKDLLSQKGWGCVQVSQDTYFSNGLRQIIFTIGVGGASAISFAKSPLNRTLFRQMRDRARSR